MNWIKQNGATILAAVLGAVVAALLGLILAKPTEGPYPTVEVAWISFPMATFYNIDDVRKEPNLLPSMGRQFGQSVTPLLVFFANSERRDFTLFTVTVSNKTDRRTKEVDISGDGFCCYLVSSGLISSKFLFGREGPIKLPALQPGEETKVLILASSYSFYQSFPLHILSDGKLIQPTKVRLDRNSTPFGIVPKLIEYPELSEVVILVVLSVIAIVLLAFIHVLSILDNFPKMIKRTGNIEASRYVRFADYIRAEHPEKLPVSLRAHPASKPPEMTQSDL